MFDRTILAGQVLSGIAASQMIAKMGVFKTRNVFVNHMVLNTSIMKNQYSSICPSLPWLSFKHCSTNYTVKHVARI